ncbi:MAG: AMP-binding protein [Flavobacteriales bacterium]|nr:AMP-binding protein [Flavobacteriales bacterium]
MSSILNQLNVAANTYGDKAYLFDKTDEGWIPSSYKQVEESAKFLSASLHKLGLNRKDNFAILSEGTSRWVISEFAIVFNGAASVPLSVKLLQDELPFRLNHSDSKGIFVSKNHLDKVVNIWSQIEKENFYLIYLDEDLDYLKRKTDSANIPYSQVKSYLSLLKEGEIIYNNNFSEMRAIVEEISIDDVVTISYTSGTTGSPKGIMLSHKNYFSNSADGVRMFKADEKLKTLIILPIDHCFAHTVAIFGALFSGMKLYFLDTRGGALNAIKNIPINLKEVKPDFLLTVPALSGNLMKKITDGIAAKGGFVEKLFNAGLEAGIRINRDAFQKAEFWTYLKDYPAYFLAKKIIFSKLKGVFGGNIKYLVGGGALLDIKQQQFFYTIGVPVYQGYGLTEATPIISSNSPFQHKLGTSGVIMPSVKCSIICDGGTVGRPDEKGEIVIVGDNVMLGYYKNIEATDEVIKDGVLYTGDLGYFDRDGYLVVTGREKALLISEDGEKYSPEEIEEGLVFHSRLISQAIIHNSQRKFTSAIITLEGANVKSLIKSNKIVDAQELYEVIEREVKAFRMDPVYKNKFPSKWMPSMFFIAPESFNEDNLMMNSTLKIVRFKVEEVYKKDIEDMYASNGAEFTRNINIAVLKKLFF